MTLQSSGAISLNQIHVEAGGSSGSQASINDADIRALIGKSSGATMSFSEWYGASAAVTIATGNSFYQAGSQYTTEQHSLKIVGAQFTTGFASCPNFTLNSRTTQCHGLTFSSIGSQYILQLMDIQGGGSSSITRSSTGHPQNAGWTTLVLSGNGGTRTFTRSSATFQSFNAIGYNNVYYSGAGWTFPAGISNLFPNSSNTTSFTLTIQ